jgi:hypothetical protein
MKYLIGLFFITLLLVATFADDAQNQAGSAVAGGSETALDANTADSNGDGTGDGGDGDDSSSSSSSSDSGDGDDDADPTDGDDGGD